MLTTLSRSMHPDNLEHLKDELARVLHCRGLFAGLYRDDHEWRRWEYCIALAACGTREELRGKSVLDVGGADVLLAPMLAWCGAHVTVNDLGGPFDRTLEAGRIAVSHPTCVPGGSLKVLEGDFTKGTSEQYDVVTCVSVIEHVPDDDAFFHSLLRAVKPGGTLALTTDFDPSGKPFCTAHLRTYTPEVLERIGKLNDGFVSEGGFDYYPGHGRWVLGYSFASLVLRRVK